VTASQTALTAIDAAITTVSASRSTLGATQNRLEHKIANINVSVENLAASESRIRDADMAQEMVQFTRNQILSQAGTAMLAESNKASQGVLQLLR
jgi:flagellin